MTDSSDGNALSYAVDGFPAIPAHALPAAAVSNEINEPNTSIPTGASQQVTGYPAFPTAAEAHGVSVVALF